MSISKKISQESATSTLRVPGYLYSSKMRASQYLKYIPQQF